MRYVYLLLPLAAALTTPARADVDVDVSANAAVVSDYRYRGLSLSDRDPALQGGVDLSVGPLFVGAWASTIADYEGAGTELDLYAGLQGRVADVALAGGAYAYLYPGARGVNYVELTASAERGFGPFTAGLEAAWTPRQDNIERANRYLGVSGALDAGAGWGLKVRTGYENGFYDSKWDWELGVSYSRGPLTAAVSYVDTNYGAAHEAGRLGQGGLIGSLAAEF